MEHSSEKEMGHYLKLHPHANPKNHKVKKDQDGGKAEEEEKSDKGGSPKDEKGHGQHHEDDEEVAVSNKQKVVNVFNRLSDKAKALITSAPAAVQKFVADEGHRKKVLKDATLSVLKSPKAYAKNLVNTAKEEVHEFKEAGKAIKDVIAGKKLDAHQKKAVKTVAIHMAITAAAAALSTTGVFTGAAFVGKAMAKKVAMKAATKALEKVHLFGELHHISHEAIHGLAEMLERVASEQDEDDEEELSPEEALAALVMKSLSDVLEDFEGQDIVEALDEASDEKQKTAWKMTTATASDLPGLIARALQTVKEVQGILSGFDRTLIASRHESDFGDGRVAQTFWVKFFKDLGKPLATLEDVSFDLEGIYLESRDLADVANEARNLLVLPRRALITYAISDIDFSTNPTTGQDVITYSVAVLKDWAKNLESWVKSASTKLSGLARKAKD